MAVKIAIVEDDPVAAGTIQSYIERYGEENAVPFRITTFSDAVSLLDPYSAEYDIIFMDIQMPYLNGMDAARMLRSYDQTVILIFITSLMQYAIEGYEVNALSYIVKPVNYYEFAMKLDRAIKRVPFISSSEIVFSSRSSGEIRLSQENIRYVEISGHWVMFHTLSGDYSAYSTLSKIEEQLSPDSFARCNSCFLVNLFYIRHIDGSFAVLDDGTKLKISQPKKKSFLQRFNEYAQQLSKQRD